MELEFESPKVCDNPKGQCSQLFKDDPVGWLWRIDNPRWFSTQPDQCNKTSIYVFGGKTFINGASVDISKDGFIIDNIDVCITGMAWIFDKWTGTYSFKSYQKENDDKWYVELDASDFDRKVVADCIFNGPPDSEFFKQTRREEIFHKNQMEEVNHWFYGVLFNRDRVVSRAEKFIKLIAEKDRQKAHDLASRYFDAALEFEERLYESAYEKYQCLLEREAKIGTGQTHANKLECTYPWCGEQ